MNRTPLTQAELHEIGVRRRGDADVNALLLEIERLHGVVQRAHELAAPLIRYTESRGLRPNLDRLGKLFEEEQAILDLPPRPK